LMGPGPEPRSQTPWSRHSTHPPTCLVQKLPVKSRLGLPGQGGLPNESFSFNLSPFPEKTQQFTFLQEDSPQNITVCSRRVQNACYLGASEGSGDRVHQDGASSVHHCCPQGHAQQPLDENAKQLQLCSLPPSSAMWAII